MDDRLNLVTGCFGFSGSYVLRELLRSGQRVVGTDLPSALKNDDLRRTLRAVGLELDHPDLELVSADLLDPSSLGPLFERPVTHVFHTASLYDYSAPLERLRRINVEGGRNLLEAALGRRLARFLHWSTCGVFGKPYTAADGPRVNVPFSERSPSPRNTPDDAAEPPGTHLVNPYSVTKWEQEKMFWRAHRERGLPLTVVRPAPIYGPGSAYGHGGIILAIAQGLLPVMPADARNFITTSVHVEDMARFACFVADRPEAAGEDYNVVDSSIISYAEFLQYIALLTGRRIRELPLVKQRHLRLLMVAAARAWTWLEQTYGVPRVTVMEVQSATYVSSSYWLSNRKSLETGFGYRFADVREGLKQTVAWLGDVGWLTDRRRLMGVHAGGTKA